MTVLRLRLMVGALLNDLTELQALESVSLPFRRVVRWLFLDIDGLLLWRSSPSKNGGPAGADGLRLSRVWGVRY